MGGMYIDCIPPYHVSNSWMPHALNVCLDLNHILSTIVYVDQCGDTTVTVKGSSVTFEWDGMCLSNKWLVLTHSTMNVLLLCNLLTIYFLHVLK